MGLLRLLLTHPHPYPPLEGEGFVVLPPLQGEGISQNSEAVKISAYITKQI
jgi:hypothetical protein